MTAPGARAGQYGEPWKKYASMVFSAGPHGFNVCCLSAPHVPRTGPDGEACDLVEHHELEMSDPDFNAAHDRGARIVACVNACAGIEDPPALLAANARLVARCAALEAALERVCCAFEADADVSPTMPVRISVETNGGALSEARALLTPTPKEP